MLHTELSKKEAFLQLFVHIAPPPPGGETVMFMQRRILMFPFPVAEYQFGLPNTGAGILYSKLGVFF